MSHVSMSQSLKNLEIFFSHVQLLVTISKPGGLLSTTIPIKFVSFPSCGKISNSKCSTEDVSKINQMS